MRCARLHRVVDLYCRVFFRCVCSVSNEFRASSYERVHVETLMMIWYWKLNDDFDARGNTQCDASRCHGATPRESGARGGASLYSKWWTLYWNDEFALNVVGFVLKMIWQSDLSKWFDKVIWQNDLTGDVAATFCESSAKRWPCVEICVEKQRWKMMNLHWRMMNVMLTHDDFVYKRCWISQRSRCLRCGYGCFWRFRYVFVLKLMIVYQNWRFDAHKMMVYVKKDPAASSVFPASA